VALFTDQIVNQMFIDGAWVYGGDGETLPIVNPANGMTFGRISVANHDDVERGLQAAKRGFEIWRRTSASDRQKVLEAAARLIESRLDAIAESLTIESGKPLAEARMELNAAIDVLRWYGEEGKRAYGRIVPPRVPGMRQSVIREPIGPVIAFVAWNFPAINFMRKVAGALAAGCSIVIKPSEETPVTGNHLAKAFADAGMPAGVLNVIYGDPAQISQQMCASPIPRKLTFTGSTDVGRHLWTLASQNLLRCTMELGGHAPFIVFDDADVALAAKLMVVGKFRNAGQVCVSPTRFYVQAGVYDAFLAAVVANAQKMRVGDGLEAGIDMGPLINQSRVSAMEVLLADSLKCGAQIAWRGKIPISNGSFFAPTILRDIPETARIMNEEPFGPIAPVVRFDNINEVMQRANHLPYGLAAYAFTTSAYRAAQVADQINAGMTAINSLHIASPETPFGGVDWSGQGSEGGPEGLDAFLRTRIVTELFQ
jgi:succinate-semialdehyde dehydrogenase/glutarate-semialdehyde dehydrogenase